MSRNFVVGVCALMCLAARASAQTWLSADVGSVAIAGSAALNGDTWTVSASGDDIWGTADAFHFLYQHAPASGSVVARVDDLQNTNAFAKAGVMVRDSLDPGASTVILDVKPDGFIELMERDATGGAMSFRGGKQASFPVWLRLSWGGGTMWADTSTDGLTWSFLSETGIVRPEVARLAVTSHDNTQLATAHFTGAQVINAQPSPRWSTSDVGDVGVAGTATESNGQWTVTGAGADIWGTQDAFRFVYRTTDAGGNLQLLMRVDSLSNTATFAKVGLMARHSLDPGAAAVIVDVTPSGNLEFMQRPSNGGEMQYLGGAQVTFPVWLQLNFVRASGAVRAGASYSYDKQLWLPASSENVPFALDNPMYAGAAVTSHDTSHPAIARFEGLSLLEYGRMPSEIGSPQLIGNATSDRSQAESPLTVQGGGRDIWGTSDSFEFVADVTPSAPNGFGWLTEIHASHPFAKAGLMYRDGYDPSAQTVILDLKPDGGVEFMARLCTGCPMTFLKGAQVGMPAWLTLFRNGSTISAQARTADQSQSIDLGSVEFPIEFPLAGVAVTSHDDSQLATALFSDLTIK